MAWIENSVNWQNSFSKFPLASTVTMAGGSSSGRELTREGASPGPMPDTCVSSLAVVRRFKRHLPEHPKLRQSCHRLSSQPIRGSWRSFRWQCYFTTKHGRTSMSAETLNVGENHQIQEQDELVSFFRNLQRPNEAQSWRQRAIDWPKTSESSGRRIAWIKKTNSVTTNAIWPG